MISTIKHIFKFFLILLLVSTIAYVGIISYLLHYEKDLIFVGQNNSAVESTIPPSFRSETINNQFGQTEIYTNTIDSKKIIFYFPGNNENANYYLQNLENFFPNTKIVSINYPNYGKSSYPYSQKNIELNSLDIVNQLSKNKNAIIIGRSIGTGFASFVASHINNLDKLALITPYSRIQNLACDLYSFIPDFVCQSFMDYKMDNVDNLYKIKNKDSILIIYSPTDNVIPVNNIETLQRHFPDLNYVKYPTATHNDINKYFEEDNSLANFVTGK